MKEHDSILQQYQQSMQSIRQLEQDLMTITTKHDRVQHTLESREQELQMKN